MDAFEWQRATSAQDAATRATHTTAEAMLGIPGNAAKPQATLVKAAGVDVLDLMKDGLISPERLIDISGLSELQGIREETDGGFTIGALTTLAQLAAHPALQQHYAALAEAAGLAASPQIRNRATLAGNLLQRPRCWYLRSGAHHCVRKGGEHCFAYGGDNRYHAIFANQDGCAIVHPSTPATALLALQAQVQCVRANGDRRVIALENLFVRPSQDPHREHVLGADELITAIKLPAPRPSARSAYVQLSEKASFDWPLAAVAAVLLMGDEGVCLQARVVLGAAAPVAWRVRQAEAILEGAPISRELANAAADAALATATPLSGNAYKIPLFRALIVRALQKAVASQTRTPASAAFAGGTAGWL